MENTIAKMACKFTYVFIFNHCANKHLSANEAMLPQPIAVECKERAGDEEREWDIAASWPKSNCQIRADSWGTLQTLARSRSRSRSLCRFLLLFLLLLLLLFVLWPSK